MYVIRFLTKMITNFKIGGILFLSVIMILLSMDSSDSSPTESLELVGGIAKRTVAYDFDKGSSVCDCDKCPVYNSSNNSAVNKYEINNSTNMSPKSVQFRLSKDVTPTHYDLQLSPDLNTGLFSGIVKINIDVSEKVDKISIHSKNLNIIEASLKSSDENEVDIVKFYTIDSLEQLVFDLGEPISSGTYILTIKYDGDMKNRIVGIYQSSYKLSSGDFSKIATSKFEPTYARQAFPCFDEPAMKAIFSVKLVRPDDYISLSNMDLIPDESNKIFGDNNMKIDTFRTSVPMSTYLACFIICNFEYKSEKINTSSIGEEFPLRVYATSEQIEKVTYPLEIGKKVTEYYIKYFNIEYPLPKLDMIAIPDFVSGAMEHWGLVTFRETNLLYDNKTTSPANKQNIARVVAHEVSHMWFGNLVTMKWWNDLWLNEGFASYMQYKALDEVTEDWHMLEQFLSSNTHSVMALDGTLSSHPIVVPVETPDEITSIFDSISYNKGAAILRMLEGFIGAENFKKGVQEYLDKFKYKNTVTKDFLDVLEKHFTRPLDGTNLTHIMDTWTRQMGLPVVMVEMIDETSYNLTQKRFLADPLVKPEPSEFNDKWYIPITYTTDKGASSELIWFSDTADNVVLKSKENEKVLKINNDQVGYYRVNYEMQMWDNIKTALNDPKKIKLLTPSDRAHLLNDVFSLAEAGEVEYGLALDISKYLVNENEYVPWTVALSQFTSLKRIMSNSLADIEFKKFVRNLVQEIYHQVGWEENDVHIESLKRSVVLNLACSFGIEDCLNKTKTMFQDWINEKTRLIDPNLKNIVYYNGIATTGEEEWLVLWDRFIKETDAQEKSKYMHALAASRDPSILKRYINYAWDTNNVRTQDYFSVLQFISSNPVGTPIVWDYFRDHWNDIIKRFTPNSRVLGTTVPAITRSFATKQKLKEMEDFFSATSSEAGAGATAREQAREIVKNNIKWMSSYEPVVADWLKKSASQSVTGDW